MRYELLLQPRTPGEPYPEDTVRACLTGRGALLAPDGTQRWKLASGEVEARSLFEAGAVVATELRIPLSEKADLPRELLHVALLVAEEAQVQLFDPQLNRSLSDRDDGALTDQYLRLARYAGEFLGLPEAIGAGFPAPENEGMGAGTKVALALGGLGLVLYLIQNLLLG